MCKQGRTYKHDNRRGGYIALTASLIIMVLVLVIVLTLSLSTILGGSGISNSYYKEISYILAQSCVDTALLKLVNNSSYAGNETITVSGTDTCRIFSISDIGSQKVITTQGKFRGARTNLKVTVNESDNTIASWEEVVSF